MRTIIVPTDFSVPAGHAVELAARLALKHGATLRLVHSVDVPDTWLEGRFTSAGMARKAPREQQALYPEARERVGRARAELERTATALERRKVEVLHELAPNAAWKDVMALAAAHKADLIVMGTHGAGALKEAFIGSNTQRVVRMATVPVITLHHAPPARIANVVIPCDPLTKGLERWIPRLIAPLEGQRAKFHLLYVNTPGHFQDTDTTLEQLRKVAAKLEPEVALHITDHFSVAEGAMAFANRAGMDMIALPTHGRGAIQGFLNASVAETVADRASIPVITLRVG